MKNLFYIVLWLLPCSFALAQDADLEARKAASTVDTAPVSEMPSPNPAGLNPRPLDGKPPVPALPEMLARLAHSEDPELRRRSVEGIATLAPAIAGAHLLLLCGDPNESVRAAALGKMRERDPDELKEQLLDLLERPQGALLMEADGSLHALGAMLGDRMLALLRDAEAPLHRRALAAYCIGQMRHADAYETLRELMWTAPTELGYACVDALFALDDARLEPDWLKLSEAQDPWLQSYAVSGLAREPTVAGLDMLYSIASGQIPSSISVQEQALQGMVVWPAHQSVPYLISVLRFNPSLQAQSMDALRLASGVDVGKFPASWHEWYREESAAAEAMAQGAETPPPLEPSESGNALMETVDFVPPPMKTP